MPLLQETAEVDGRPFGGLKGEMRCRPANIGQCRLGIHNGRCNNERENEDSSYRWSRTRNTRAPSQLRICGGFILNSPFLAQSTGWRRPEDLLREYLEPDREGTTLCLAAE